MIGEDLTSLEALAVAIRAEADAAELYAELAARVENVTLRQKIDLLAKEELQHKRLLEEQYSKQFPDVPLVLPPSQLPREICSKTERDHMSVKDILACAIEEERRSREFYLDQAEKCTDLTGQRMFHFLADWEFSHQMALSAEYEMVVRYPRYFEQNLESWRVEFRR